MYMPTPPRRGVGVTCTSRSRGTPPPRTGSRVCRTTPVARKVTTAEVRSTSSSSRMGTPAPLPPARAVRPSRLKSRAPFLRPLLPAGAQAFGVTPSTSATSSAGTAPSRRIRGSSPVRSTIVDATPCSAGPPSRYTLAGSPSCSRACSTVGGGRAARRCSRSTPRAVRPHAATRGHRVQRHAQHHRAPGVAEIPRQRRCLLHNQTQPAGPERPDEFTRSAGARCDQAVDRVPRADEDGHRHVASASLGPQQGGDSLAVECVGGESVQRVGGHDDEAPGLERVLAPRSFRRRANRVCCSRTRCSRRSSFH